MTEGLRPASIDAVDPGGAGNPGFGAVPENEPFRPMSGGHAGRALRAAPRQGAPPAQSARRPAAVSTSPAPCRRSKLRFPALLLHLLAGALALPAAAAPGVPEMHWADTASGRPYSKDPSVIRFGGRYLMYYSLPGKVGGGATGWSVGIAASTDLRDWQKVGSLGAGPGAERKGIAAPAAWVRKGRVHLFYQTYGNGRDDAICHAWSDDGLRFTRNPSNPVFAPTGSWNAGRAIDADVFPVGERLFLYFATRDPQMKVQMLGVAAAPLDSDYGRAQWKQLADAPILKPELPWEKDCIEAASVMRRDGKLWMFYAGAYNNAPQQIGAAWSDDGIRWTRASDQPLVPVGPAGSWNSSESGHPGVFVDEDGTTHLFYQGNDDKGKTWYLSRIRIDWRDGRPVAAPAAAAGAGQAPADWPAWAAWAEALHPVTDAEGHGPDVGSDEWAMALARKLGVIDAGDHGPDLRSAEWRAAVEKKLREAKRREPPSRASATE
jgi:hypothetical protein